MFAFFKRVKEGAEGKTSSRDPRMRCEKVRAVRCRIEKKTVTKTKPETKCQRVPRQFCREVECQEERTVRQLINKYKLE